MLDLNDLLTAIKKAAVDAVESTKPVGIIYGRVISVSPLKINVDNRMILGADCIVVPKSFGTHKISVNINGELHEGSIDNRLLPGDSLILLSSPGGQKHIILGRATS